MRVLVVGSGGREHALAWKLLQSSSVDGLICAPGNLGMGEYGDLVDVGAEDVAGITELAKKRGVDLVIVGPEVPLVNGLADELNREGVAVFGPSAGAARIEGSKSWANDLMYRYGIPCPSSISFKDSESAIRYLDDVSADSIVVKADGLAAGKGVVLPESHADGVSAVRDALEYGVFGDAGSTVVIEERLNGLELSVFAFVDGEDVSVPVAARDYKRAYDGDLGLNTGGMGAYTSPSLCSDFDLDVIRDRILQPVASALVEEDCPYQGVLFAGLMLTDSGPQVIEFNCRFGDPECEVLMMRLDSDLADICMAVADGSLSDMTVEWNDASAVCVVVVSGGYPSAYETGHRIEMNVDSDGLGDDAMIFHAGTSLDDSGCLVTAGGRVLVATASSVIGVSDARERAYELVSGISFEDSRHRIDIGLCID